jgi:putative ABC transport system permease protein
MTLALAIRVGLQAMRRSLMRTVLTMLGVVIGVAAVIAIVALGVGARQSIEDRITSAGANMIIVMAGNRTIGGVRLGMGASSRLTEADANALRALPGVQFVSPGLHTHQQVVSGGQNWSTSIEGSGADLPSIHQWPVQEGSFFGEHDVTTAEPVAVLGAAVRNTLFGPGGPSPVGQIVRIGVVPFRIIGVMKSRGETQGGQDQDDAIYVPFTTVQKRLMGVTYLNQIRVSAATAERVPAVTAQITRTLRVRHNIQPGAPDDFRVRDLQEIADLRSAGAQTMTWLLAGIAAVSLVVGGIGIMNIMLVAVSERTREIGIRVAIGAKERDVMLQFLVEASLMSAGGGVVGVVLGIAVARGLTAWFGWPTSVPLSAVVIAFGVAGGIGVAFGFLPARRAARLDPIDALRFE